MVRNARRVLVFGIVAALTLAVAPASAQARTPRASTPAVERAVPAEHSPAVPRTTQRWPVCKEYIFVGMRGSGQTYESGKGVDGSAYKEVGRDLGIVYLRLKDSKRFKGKITYMGVASYNAMGVEASADYLREVINYSGASLLVTLGSVADRCPRSKFIFAGYSQGAYAVRSALVALESGKSGYEKYLPRISAAAVLADPGNPNAGILYALKAVASQEGVFRILSALYAQIKPFYRIGFVEAVLEVAPLARSHAIAGTPESVPFASVHLTEDVVGEGKTNLDVWIPLWRDIILYNSLGLQPELIKEQMRIAARNVTRWVKTHSVYGEKPTYLRDKVGDWLIANAK
jgi:hypothetical protein